MLADPPGASGVVPFAIGAVLTATLGPRTTLGIAAATVMMALWAVAGWFITRAATDRLLGAVAPDRPRNRRREAILGAVIWGAMAAAGLIVGLIRVLHL